MHIEFLRDIVVIFASAIVVLLICHRLKIPTILGFLVTGTIAGPHGFQWAHDMHVVEVLAEIGVILLMFTIGIELSLEHLLRVRRAIFIGGSLQVGITVLFGFLLSKAFEIETNNAIFMGMLFSLSSTAIVLQLLQKRGEIDSPHGSTTLGILIFQDLIIVPMILLTPLLGTNSSGGDTNFLIFAGKAVLILVAIFVLAKWVIPHALHAVARTRDREFFLLAIVAICCSIAWMTSTAGLSLALGAFLAGLILSESDYSHSALGHILPFRDVFTSFFFVSVGMLFDISILVEQPVRTFGIAAAVLAAKAIIAGGAVRLLGFPPRTAVLAGFALAQVGEFSFILSKIGVTNGLGTEYYQTFLAVSVLTMAVTPFLISIAPRLADRIAGAAKAPEGLASQQAGHLVIIGFGVNGRNLARAAKSAEIPYVVIEMSPDTVRSERARGEPIFHGDATQEAILEHAAVGSAKTIVVAINDPAATRRITRAVRQFNPHAHLLVRTRYLTEMSALMDLGATEVIPEEFETSIEIFARVLTSYLVPRQLINELIANVRDDGYRMLRSTSWDEGSGIDLKTHLPEVEIQALRVEAGSDLDGKTLREARLRDSTGITVLAIRKGASTESNPDPDTRLEAGDLAFFLATRTELTAASERFLSAGEA